MGLEELTKSSITVDILEQILCLDNKKCHDTHLTNYLTRIQKLNPVLQWHGRVRHAGNTFLNDVFAVNCLVLEICALKWLNAMATGPAEITAPAIVLALDLMCSACPLQVRRTLPTMLRCPVVFLVNHSGTPAFYCCMRTFPPPVWPCLLNVNSSGKLRGIP